MTQKNFYKVETKLESLASPGIVPGLTRLNLLLPLLGDPQKKFPAVHVVGTNGKGSTCTTVDAICKEAGYKTALYTSPHLVSFGERLEIAGEQVPCERWIYAAEKIEAAIASSPALQNDRPTYFELVTAAAFLLIAEEAPDIAILEAGLGGRLDATNTVEHILLTLITPIGVDHTEYLGDTVEKIAAEKFAVMREGSFALFAGGTFSIDTLYKKTAQEKKARAFLRDEICQVAQKKTSIDGTDFSLSFLKKNENEKKFFHTPLIGLFQAENAALAIAGVTLLAKKLPVTQMRYGKIDDESIARGVAHTRWQGRLEKVADDPLLILDGAHNPHAMKKLAETLAALLEPGSFNLVLAVMHDKDVETMLDLLRPLRPAFFCTEVPGMERCLKADVLAEIARKKIFSVKGVFPDPIAAIEAARAEGKATVCCGSLYLVGYVKGHLSHA